MPYPITPNVYTYNPEKASLTVSRGGIPGSVKLTAKQMSDFADALERPAKPLMFIAPEMSDAAKLLNESILAASEKLRQAIGTQPQLAYWPLVPLSKPWPVIGCWRAGSRQERTANTQDAKPWPVIEAVTCARCDEPHHPGRKMFRRRDVYFCGDCMSEGTPLKDQPKTEPDPINYHAWMTPCDEGVGGL